MIHWFKRHPKHLENESCALSNDKNYKESYQARNNFFISAGSIIVRLDKIHRFPILIVYPEATPYAIPLIFPLKEPISNDDVSLLSKCSFHELSTQILPKIKFYYHLRHQNQSGNLCILEWDNLDDGSKFFGIENVLKRVRDWYAGTITGNFPPDSDEVAFYSHFNNIDLGHHFLYPQPFLDEKYVEGDAYGLLYNILPMGKYNKLERRIYFGCLLTGKTKSGIFENVDCMLPNFFIEEGINNSIELVTKEAVVRRLVNNGKLLKTSWFQIEKEPNLFQTLPELLTIIGNGNRTSGILRLMPFYIENLKLKPESFFIAIRFPNRKNAQEFQLFNVIKKQENAGTLIGLPEHEIFEHLIGSYEIVNAILCDKFTDESFHQRNAGRAERNILKDKFVNIVGVGALGSEIADCLGKAGVGNITLFDNQEIKVDNPVRHLAGLDQIGAPKAAAIADIIGRHNLFINIKSFTGSIDIIDLNDFFADDSIAVSSIADDNTEGFLNERAVIANKVIYYARALRGAKCARIFRVIPGKDACFHCLDLYRKEKQEFVSIDEDKELPTLKNECNNPIRPASAADLKLISSLAARIILDELQNGFREINHWIWSSEKLYALEPFQLISQTIKPHPYCYYCTHKQKAKVFLTKDLEEQMKALVLENTSIETGGVLAGRIDENGDVVLTNISGPGPKAKKSATKFEKDIEFCQQFLDNLYVTSGKKIIYVGEWHSHPSDKNQPSSTDLKSLTEISIEKEYLTDRPTMIIFSNTGIPSCTIHPAGKSFYYAEIIRV